MQGLIAYCIMSIPTANIKGAVMNEGALNQAGSQSDEQNECHFNSVPEEVTVGFILAECDPDTLVQFSLTCKKFHKLANDDFLWKKLTIENFPHLEHQPENTVDETPQKTFMRAYKDLERFSLEGISMPLRFRALTEDPEKLCPPTMPLALKEKVSIFAAMQGNPFALATLSKQDDPLKSPTSATFYVYSKINGRISPETMDTQEEEIQPFAYRHALKYAIKIDDVETFNSILRDFGNRDRFEDSFINSPEKTFLPYLCKIAAKEGARKCMKLLITWELHSQERYKIQPQNIDDEVIDCLFRKINAKKNISDEYIQTLLREELECHQVIEEDEITNESQDDDDFHNENHKRTHSKKDDNPRPHKRKQIP